MKLIQFKTLIPGPWKNGLGITYQLDIYPDSSGFSAGGYDFRVSMAKVNSDNDFSIFESKMRYLKIIEGKGIVLNQKELLFNQSIFFSGDEKIHASLIKPNDQILDLGIIYNPKKVLVAEVEDKLETGDESFCYYFFNFNEEFKILQFEMKYLDALVFYQEDFSKLSEVLNLEKTLLIKIKFIG